MFKIRRDLRSRLMPRLKAGVSLGLTGGSASVRFKPPLIKRSIGIFKKRLY